MKRRKEAKEETNAFYLGWCGRWRLKTKRSGTRINFREREKMAVSNLTEKDFVSAVCGEGVSAVLEFYAMWCKPCHKMLPVIEKLSEEYKDIKFYKIDADEEILLAGAFKASTLPTLVFVEDGIVKDVAVGNVQEEEILKCIKKIKK